MSVFSKRLVEIMEEKQISQAELSRMTGIRQSSLSGYMLGTYEAKQDNIGKLARALDVPPSYLLGWDESETVEDQDEIDLDSFEFALSTEAKNMTDEMKQSVLDFMRFIKEQEKKEK